MLHDDNAAYHWPPEGAPELPPPSNLVSGASFILDAPTTVPAVWGRDDQVLWAEGEALTLCGGSGVGKTTITGQVIHAMLTGGGEVLGLPVAPRERVLYLAMDRPRQIARSLRRQFGPADRDALERGLIVHPGPTLTDAARDTFTLVRLAEQAQADVLIVDSVKDAAIGLSDDAVGAGFNQARQRVIAAGVDVMELHHLTKRAPGGGAPRELSDVYGSGWITAGSGSVVLLDGKAGAESVELLHLKQPAEVVGPLDLVHDRATGRTCVTDGAEDSHGSELLAVLASHGGRITARELADALDQAGRADRAAVQRARRQLDALVSAGTLAAEVQTAAVGQGVKVYAVA